MSRCLTILLLLFSQIYAKEAINGTTFLLEFNHSTKPDVLIFEGKNVPIIKTANKDGYISLIPIPYKSEKYINITLVIGENNQTIEIPVSKKEYKKEFLSVDPLKVKPPKSAQERIDREYKEAVKIYNTINEDIYWTKPFITPMNSAITSEYGNARTYNNELKSFHGGVDYRAAIGAPVLATNDGTVALAKDRYYAGGSIVIDHGGGVYSTYFHLQDINVSVGAPVKRGDVIATSGASGRVTGPHLHFGIMLLGSAINPLDFIEKVNSTF